MSEFFEIDFAIRIDDKKIMFRPLQGHFQVGVEICKINKNVSEVKSNGTSRGCLHWTLAIVKLKCEGKTFAQV